MAGKSVQGVITRKDVTLANIAVQSPEASWLKDVTVAPIAVGEDHLRYDHLPESSFVPGTIEVVPISRAQGAWAVVGVLVEGADKNSAIMVDTATMRTDQQRAVPASPMQTMNGYGTGTSAEVLGDAFYREWYALQDILWGTLTQSSLTTKQRKTMISAAVSGFDSFMGMLLDTLGGDDVQRSADFSKAVAPVLDILGKTLALSGKNTATTQTRSAEADNTLTGGTDMGFEFKDENDFVTKVADTVRQVIRAEDDAKVAAAKALEEKQRSEQMAQTIVDLSAEVKRLGALLDGKQASPADPVPAPETTEQHRAEHPAPAKSDNPLAAFDNFMETMIAGA